MPYLVKQWNWRAVGWWIAVLCTVVMLKHHYSTATAADLEWILHPLSLVLEWISGHPFRRDSLHQWVSASADVRLVKACAGINFLLMSALAWAWVLRPDRDEDADPPAWICRRLLIFLLVWVAAWASSLIANSLRILVAMNLPAHDADTHRLIGMLIYVPLLSLQLRLGDRGSSTVTFAGPVLLYLVLMALVPLLTGNAFRNPVMFLDHLLYLSAMAAVMGGSYIVCRMFRQFPFVPHGSRRKSGRTNSWPCEPQCVGPTVPAADGSPLPDGACWPFRQPARRSHGFREDESSARTPMCPETPPP